MNHLGRFGLNAVLDDDAHGALIPRLIRIRKKLMRRLSAPLVDHVEFFDKEKYLFYSTVAKNLTFGSANLDSFKEHNLSKNPFFLQFLQKADLIESLVALGTQLCRQTVIEIGLKFQVGIRGDRLSGGQRQKIAIARAFLKNPGILIMDEATSALDNRSQARIQHVLDAHWKGNTTLIAVVHRLDIINNFDKIAVMKSGKVEELGAYEELMNRKGLLYDLVGAKK